MGSVTGAGGHPAGHHGDLGQQNDGGLGGQN